MFLKDPSRVGTARRTVALTSLLLVLSVPTFAADEVQPDLQESNPNGGCCLPDGTCTIKSWSECMEAGGVFLASQDPCDLPCAGACCLPDGSCTIVFQSECRDQGGVFQGPQIACDPLPCAGAFGACCLPTGCVFQDQVSCERIGGAFLGVGMSCDRADCVLGTPSLRISWGVLKSLHRMSVRPSSEG